MPAFNLVGHFSGVDVQYASTGNLRTTGAGSLNVAGVSGTITAAYLVWHSLTDTTSTTAGANVTFNGTNIVGTHQGSSNNNSWGVVESQTYMADVTSFVSGNGAYSLSNFNVSGVQANGATLIIIFNDGNAANNKDLSLFVGNDANQASAYDGDGWDQSFANITYSGSGAASLVLGVADGQDFGVSDDGTVSINGSALDIGTGFDGGAGEFWDVGSYSLTPFLSAGAQTLNLTHVTGGDAFSLVFAAIELPTPNELPVIVYDPPVTITFPNNVTGTPTSYSEGGLTFFSDSFYHLHFDFGDMDGDGSPELFNHAGGSDVAFIEKTGGGRFSLYEMDSFGGGTATWIAYVKDGSGNYVEQGRQTFTASGHVVLSAVFQNVDRIRWESTSGNIGIDNVQVERGTVLSGAVTEVVDLAAGEGSTVHAADGSIAFTDADALDTHSASVVANGAGYRGSMTLSAVDQAADDVAWTFNVADSAIDDLAVGQTLTQNYTVTITDSAGGTDSETVSITLTGRNDAPTLNAASTIAAGTATEIADLAVGENATNITATGQVGFADVDLIDTHGATITPNAVGYVGSMVLSAVDQAANHVAWTFSIADSAVDYLAAGQSIVQAYTVAIDDGHGGTVSQTVTVTIQGTNDAPTIVSGAAGMIRFDGAPYGFPVSYSEAGLLFTSPTHLHFDFDLDNDRAYELTNHAGGSDIAYIEKQGGGRFSLFEMDTSNQSESYSGGSVTWIAQISDGAGGYIEQGRQTITGGGHVLLGAAFQNIDRVVWDSSAGTLTIDNLQFNLGGGSIVLAPVAEAIDLAAGENATTYSRTGSVAFADVDTADVHSATVSENGIGYRGTLVLGTVDQAANDVDWTFTLADSAIDDLAAGQTLTQAYTITIDDGKGGTATQILSVTITGTNDAPTIVGAATVATGGVTEIADLAAGENATTLTATGTVAFADVDTIDTHSASVAANGANYRGTLTLSAVDQAGNDVDWTFSVADLAIDDLAAGQTLTQTYTVTVNDGKGGTVSQLLTVTITGTNDTPIVSAGDVTGGVTELNAAPVGTLVDSGTLSFTDVDLTDVHAISAVTPSAGALGTLTAQLTSDTTGTGTGGIVTWDYAVPASAVEYLAAGQTRVESFTFSVLDGQGGSVARTVSVTVTGTNDAPIVAGTDVTGAVLELGTPVGVISDSGTIAFTDVDLTDVHAISAVTPSAGALGMLTAEVTTDTTGSGTGGIVTWTYAVPASAVEYLAAGETRVESFTFSILDGQGGPVERTVTVTVTGTNDAPVAQVQGAGAVAELGYDADGNLVNPSSPVGYFRATDVDTGATQTWSVVGGGDSPLGALILNTATGQWTYQLDNVAANALALGEQVVETFTIRVTDDQGTFDEESVSITITGSNDRPTISVATTTSTLLAEVADGQPGENVITHVTAGDVLFGDVDLGDTHQVTVTPLAAGYVGTFVLGAVDQATNSASWTLSVPDSALDSLSGDQSLNQQYLVTVTDSNGGSVSFTVNALLVGSNDAAILSAANVVVLQTGTPAIAAGDLTISDVDGPALFQVQNDTAGTYGSFSVDANGQWSYNAFSAYQDLTPGQALTDSFIVYAADGTPTSVTISIAGSNDVGAANPDFFTTDEATPIGSGLNLFADNGFGADSDADNSLQIVGVNGQAAAVGQTITLASGALLRVNADGTFSYDPNDAFNSLTAAHGASNQLDHDTFSYQLSDGTGSFALISIRGLNSPEDIIEGDGGSVIGTSGNDRFFLDNGGDDQAIGNAGNDGFYFGRDYNQADEVIGGAGTDTLALQGDYANLTLGSISSVELLLLLSGGDRRFGDTAGNRYDYRVTTEDANIAAGATLTVQSDGLLAGEDLVFDGSAETDGKFRIFAGQGNDILTGGGGNDGFFFGMGGKLTGADVVNGGGGTDSIALRGNYIGADAVLFGEGSMSGIETLVFLSGLTNEFGGSIVAAGFDYDVTMADGNVAAGARIDVVALGLSAEEDLRFDGRAETDGSFRFFSGAGDDQLFGSQNADLISGGLGSDQLDGAGGADTYVYRSVAESTAAARDTIVLGDGDRIDLGAIDANMAAAGNQAFAFIGSAAFSGVAGQLRAVNAGGLWTIEGDVDGNGSADLVINVTSADPIVASDFIF